MQDVAELFKVSFETLDYEVGLYQQSHGNVSSYPDNAYPYEAQHQQVIQFNQLTRHEKAERALLNISCKIKIRF